MIPNYIERNICSKQATKVYNSFNPKEVNVVSLYLKEKELIKSLKIYMNNLSSDIELMESCFDCITYSKKHVFMKIYENFKTKGIEYVLENNIYNSNLKKSIECLLEKNKHLSAFLSTK